jgi:hypothetical protein
MNRRRETGNNFVKNCPGAPVRAPIDATVCFRIT